MNETTKDITAKDSRTFISAKIQKLTSAVYLVTDFLSNSDPLKWKLRDGALETLSQIGSAAIFDSAINSIGQMISLIDVALSVPGVSQMNFSVLKKEYEEIRQKMSGVDLVLGVRGSEVRPLDSDSQGLTSIPRLNPSSKLKAIKAPNNSRHEVIIKFIKNHSWSSIKDIAKTMPEVSAKTVQRELAEMVQSGVLKKEGDRRWSRYELA